MIEGGRWNPEKNNIYVSFVQDKILREEIAKTQVIIQGEKNDVMYILETEDKKSKLKDGSMTPGRNFVLRGSYIKVVGDDASVGVTFRNKRDDTIIKLTEDMFATNNPSELIFLVPTELTDGDYELTVTTQYTKNTGLLLKTPRSVSIPVHVGSGSSDRPEIE